MRLLEITGFSLWRKVCVCLEALLRGHPTSVHICTLQAVECILMPGGTVDSLISAANILITRGLVTMVTSSVTEAPFCCVHSCSWLPVHTLLALLAHVTTGCACMQLAGIALHPKLVA